MKTYKVFHLYFPHYQPYAAQIIIKKFQDVKTHFKLFSKKANNLKIKKSFYHMKNSKILIQKKVNIFLKLKLISKIEKK